MNTTSILFTISGIVRRNIGRGRELGFPTANIAVVSDTPEGLYIGHTTVAQIKYPSLVFIGSNVTFDETDKKAEVYILDFDKDIYGELLVVDVIKKLRETMKFDTAEELIEQMKKDELEARNYF